MEQLKSWEMVSKGRGREGRERLMVRGRERERRKGMVRGREREKEEGERERGW